MMISAHKLFWVITLGACLCASGAFEARAAETLAEAPQEVEFSEAEKLLWLGDQLKAVTAPSLLEYRFTKAGTLEAGFTDSVRFTVSQVKPDGMKAAALEFFTGERRFPVPPEENTNINPVLTVFFQGDVYEMNRLTDPDGKSRERWRYFQRRIKLALAETATIEPVKFDLDGRSYTGKRLTFTPYSHDPKRQSFEKFANKAYVVMVSDDLPGFVYQIETVVPDKTAGAPPLIKETLQLISIKPIIATAKARED